MTALGKIFVIINLLFSLVVAGFIVAVYARSTNWHDAADKWQKAAQVADASRQATEGEMATVQKDAAARVAAKDQEIEGLKKAVETEKSATQVARTELENVRKAGGKDTSTVQALQAELEKRKDEVTGMEKQVAEKDKQILGLLDDKNKANDAKVAAEIKANSYQGKAERMEARLRETEVELVKLRRTGGGAAGAGGLSMVSTANPPPQDVEGIVTETSPRGDLVRISVGSDAGLAKGHTLDLFRTNPPQYLGQIRLTDVRAHEAVGVPVDKLKYPVKKGDLVASDVTPRK
jgi:hypothetical protein